MNDFTKEELNHILWVFNESYEFNDRLMDDIRFKLKSMINNYCDHEKFIYIVTGYDGCDVHIEKCFENEEQAILYKEELYKKCNDDQENEEYNFSIQEKILVKYNRSI